MHFGVKSYLKSTCNHTVKHGYQSIQILHSYYLLTFWNREIHASGHCRICKARDASIRKEIIYGKITKFGELIKLCNDTKLNMDHRTKINTQIIQGKEQMLARKH
jgi:hypothetical protein